MIVIELAGDPTGKGRPRFSRKSGTVYTPLKTARYEARLAWAAQSIMKGRPLLEGALSVYVRAFMPIPVSKSKKWRAAAAGGLVHPTKKPDIDNIAKMMDALNKVVWVDDCQIVALTVAKNYSDRPRIEIQISEFKENQLTGCIERA
jgi:Holliday junction resolvase RusA-like endonuclease